MLESVLVSTVVLTVGLLASSLLSLNLIVISLARVFARARPIPHQPLDPGQSPPVLVQIPLYNAGELVRPIDV